MSKSLRGTFLVAGPKLRDPNFFKTVVLVLEHTDEGAMGLVANRPSSLTVGNALSSHLDLSDAEEMVFVGGPVEPADLFLVHDSPELAEQSACAHPVAEGLYVTNTAEQFEAVLLGSDDSVRNRVFCGYAGWGPQQLEGELSRGDWLTIQADADILFRCGAYELWDELRRRVSRSHRILATECLDPELN